MTPEKILELVEEYGRKSRDWTASVYLGRPDRVVDLRKKNLNAARARLLDAIGQLRESGRNEGLRVAEESVENAWDRWVRFVNDANPEKYIEEIRAERSDL